MFEINGLENICKSDVSATLYLIHCAQVLHVGGASFHVVTGLLCLFVYEMLHFVIGPTALPLDCLYFNDFINIVLNIMSTFFFSLL